MRLLHHLVVTFFLAVLSTSLLAVPQVATSIKPVDDLVRAVMDGVGQPVLLIPPGSSPHTYALKPSERMAAEKAEILFWIGPQVETALAKVIKAMRPGTRIVTLAQVPGIEVLPARAGGNWDHGDKHGHAAHRHTDIDGHLWLSPKNAAAIIRAAADALSTADKVNAARYAANAKEALHRLKVLDAEIGRKLASVQNKPFIVFHDAYQYFERSYQLSAVGSVLISPEAMSSAGRVRDMRGKIKKLGAACVFAEPQFEPRLIQTLIEGTVARTGTLDPLGANLPPGLPGYEQLLRNLAENTAGCLNR